MHYILSRRPRPAQSRGPLHDVLASVLTYKAGFPYTPPHPERVLITYYNTTIDSDLLKKLKILAIEVNKRQNDLLEEAIEDLLKKYEKKAKK